MALPAFWRLWREHDEEHLHAAARSDFSLLGAATLGRALERVTGLDARLLRHLGLPVGVSIVCVAARPDV